MQYEIGHYYKRYNEKTNSILVFKVITNYEEDIYLRVEIIYKDPAYKVYPSSGSLLAISTAMYKVLRRGNISKNFAYIYRNDLDIEITEHEAMFELI